MNKSYVVEPIEFCFNDDIFNGIYGGIESKNIIDDLELAYKYAFDQNIPSGYKVWSDFIEEQRALLRLNDKFQEAYHFVREYAEGEQAKNSSKWIDYRKKKIKKNNTRKDDFIFSEAREDAFSVLNTVAINRYLDNFIKDEILEDIFLFYKCGGWPCGLRKNNILVFDPKVLD